MWELSNNKCNEPHNKNTTESIVAQNEIKHKSKNQRMTVWIYADKGTRNAGFALKNLAKRCIEENKNLLAASLILLKLSVGFSTTFCLNCKVTLSFKIEIYDSCKISILSRKPTYA